MGALRWILLLAGLVFLAALAAWELRRPRQARRDGPGDPSAVSRRWARWARWARRSGAGPGGSMAGGCRPGRRRIYTGASLGGGLARAESPPRIDLPPLDAGCRDAAGTDPRIASSAIIIDEPISALGPGLPRRS